MSPGEHFVEAEKYLDLVKDMLADPQSADAGLALPAVYMSMAQTHATLATATHTAPTIWGRIEVTE